MSLRLFLGISIPKDIQTKLGEKLSVFHDEKKTTERWVSPANWHITMAFIGNLDELTTNDLTHAFEKIVWPRPFELSLGLFGGFPNLAQSHVFWMGVDRGYYDLSRLHQTCSEKLKRLRIPFDQRPFTPHLTLSRLSRATNLSNRELMKWNNSFAFKVEALHLYKSGRREGDLVYEPIASWSF